MKNTKHWMFFSGVMLLTGCLNTNDATRVSRPMSLDSVPDLPRVDASLLMISDIQVVRYENPDLGGAVQPFVNFRYSGHAEYVEVATCVDSDTNCSEAKNLFRTDTPLANGPGGSQVTVKLRGCVDPSRALGSSNCGPWFQSTYRQWTITDRAAAELQEEREAIEVATKEVESLLKQILKLKTDRAKRCQPATAEQNAALEADRALGDALGKLGQSAIGAISNAIVSRSSVCAQKAEPVSSDPKAEGASGTASTGTPTATPTPSTASTGTSSTAATGGSKLLLSGTERAAKPTGMIGPQLSSEHLKKIIDTASDALQKNANSSGNPATAQCVAEQTAAKPGKLSIADVGEILPNIAGPIFDLITAKRQVELEGICIEKLGAKQEQAIASATETVKILATELQARQARLDAKMKGLKP